MNWVQCLQKAVNFIEEHILEDLTPERIATNIYSPARFSKDIHHVIRDHHW